MKVACPLVGSEYPAGKFSLLISTRVGANETAAEQENRDLSSVPPVLLFFSLVKYLG